MKRLIQIIWWCVQVVLVMIATNLFAQDAKQEKSNKSALSFSGQLELEFSNAYNFDLVDEVENIYTLEPTLGLGAEYDNDKDYRMVLNLEYGREWEGGDQGREDVYRTSLTLDEAFVELTELTKGDFFLDDITLTLGRGKLSDSREWYYDAEVDGLILESSLASSNTNLMLSANREEWIGSDLLRHNESDPVSNLVFSVVHHPVKKVDLGAYAIIRNDRSPDNDSPRFLGLSARGEVFNKRLNFWSDFAAVTGQYDDKNIDGIGYDAGATFKLFGKEGPYVTLGYAYGSGDGDEDTDFRQTGLHGNSDRFGGVTSIKYYGELTDPELSNLKILTVGIGYRAHSKMSVDLFYHCYEQDVALDKLRDSNIDIDPNGRETDIGAELDLVAGFTSFGNLETELVIGYFQPGAAFDDAGEALMVSAKVSYEF